MIRYSAEDTIRCIYTIGRARRNIKGSQAARRARTIAAARRTLAYFPENVMTCTAFAKAVSHYKNPTTIHSYSYYPTTLATVPSSRLRCGSSPPLPSLSFRPSPATAIYARPWISSSSRPELPLLSFSSHGPPFKNEMQGDESLLTEPLAAFLFSRSQFFHTL